MTVVFGFSTLLNMNELRETFIYIPYICGRAGKVKPIHSMKFINILGFSARKEIVHNYFEFIKLLNVKACFKAQEGTSYSGKFQHFPHISSKILFKEDLGRVILEDTNSSSTLTSSYLGHSF